MTNRGRPRTRAGRAALERWKVGLLAAGLGLVAGIFPWPGEPLRRLSLDLAWVLAAPRAPEEVLMVYLDDASHQQLKQPHGSPWDRRLHARLLTQLLSFGARVVVFDMLFDQPGADAAADRELARAVAAAGDRVVLAALLDEAQPGVRRLIEPQAELRRSTPGNSGVANLQLDADGVVRSAFHFDREWRDLQSLSWRAALAFRPELESDSADGARPGAGVRRENRLLRYYGPPGTLAQASYYEALDSSSRRAAELARGRAVFVGAGSAAGYTGDLMESVLSPYSRRDGRRIPKVDVHATQFLNLVRNESVRPFGPWFEAALVVAIGLALGLGLTRFRPGTAAVVGLGAAVIVAAGGLGLVWAGNVSVAWMLVPAIQVPAALAGVILLSRTREPAPDDRWWDAERTVEFAPGQAGRGAEPVRVPDHELVRCVGRGSCGEVWLARTALGAYRAVKIIRRPPSEAGRAYDRELEGLRRVEPFSRRHDGLVDILQVGRVVSSEGMGSDMSSTSGGFFYYVMELADDAATGAPLASEAASERYVPRTLRAVLDGGQRPPLAEVERIGLALAEAVRFLHGNGLIHRDIKPANIIFVAGQPKLADIGLIARAADAGSLVGTPGYMAPEGPGTTQADLYSLGMVLYELASGRDRREFPAFPTCANDESDPVTAARVQAWILALGAPSPADRALPVGPSAR